MAIKRFRRSSQANASATTQKHAVRALLFSLFISFSFLFTVGAFFELWLRMIALIIIAGSGYNKTKTLIRLHSTRWVFMVNDIYIHTMVGEEMRCEWKKRTQRLVMLKHFHENWILIDGWLGKSDNRTTTMMTTTATTTRNKQINTVFVNSWNMRAQFWWHSHVGGVYYTLSGVRW